MPDGRMTPENPKILIASKNATVEEMKRGGGSLPERDAPSSNFWEIQGELVKFKDHPDAKKENDLKLQRARLISDAKNIGVFDTIKPLLSEIQTKFEFDKAYKEIVGIDINALEIQAKGLHGWKDQYSGMIEYYRDGALRNMEIARFEATGNTNDPRAIELKREKELLGWGVPPQGLDLLVKRDIPQKEPAEKASVGIDTYDLAQRIAEAQGIPDWTTEMSNYVDAEDYLTAPFKIEPGKEPRFWIHLSDKEKLNWYVRSQVEISAYLKNIAASTEDLYMDKMKDFAVGLNKRYLKILFGSREKDGKIEYEGMEGVLPAVGIYTTIIGGKKFIGYKDSEDLSLKEVFCKTLDDKKTRENLEKDYGLKNLEKLEKEELELYESCADSMYPHRNKGREKDPLTGGTPISQESFRKLRESIRFWLTTKGRDFLLTDKEMQRRSDFFEGKMLENKDRSLLLTPEEKALWGSMTDAQREAKDKELAYQLIRRRARDAEQIAWNFIYSTSLLESFDSRDYRPPETKRHGPSSYWQLFQWTPMHLQERWEQKIVRKDNETNVQAKEEWAGNLGTWAVNNLRGWGVKVDSAGNAIGMPRILPGTLIRSALFGQVFVHGRDINTGKPVEKDEGTFFDVFNKIGDEVIFQTDKVTRRDIESRINWKGLGDSPFVPYIFDEMRWVDVIQQFFKKGQEAKMSFQDFAEAVRNLRIPMKDREKLLMVYEGIDVNSSYLKPKMSSFSWTLRKNSLKEYFPNFFLEK
ncbi:MAG: hypothetical protein ACD_13C00149G0002 [uncultured bacterium]|nr:MAG: hypothetical protein ACD_13C00149G0002 [uncultured bacterium]